MIFEKKGISDSFINCLKEKSKGEYQKLETFFKEFFELTMHDSLQNLKNFD